MGAYRDYYLPQVFLIVAHKARRTLGAVNKKVERAAVIRTKTLLAWDNKRGKKYCTV